MGQVKNHTTKIDGRTYNTTTFTAVEGLKLMPRLLSLMNDTTAAVLFQSTDEETAAIYESPKLLLPMMLSVASRAQLADGLGVIQDLLIHTTCDQVEVGDTKSTQPVGTDRFGAHFAGDYYHLFRVAWWVARVSFAGP